METARLVLRDLQYNDAAALARVLCNYKITRNTSNIPHPYSLADALKFIANQKAKSSASVKMVICLKFEPDRLIGSVRLHIDSTAKTCELGYWIAETSWGQGYAGEAASFMVDHAFTVLKQTTITADYNVDNPTSGRVLQRLGFVEIGSGESFSLAQGKMVPVTFVKFTQKQWNEKYPAPYPKIPFVKLAVAG